MKVPDGEIFIFHEKKFSIDVEQRELVMCKNCKCKDKYENFCWRFLREIDPSDYCSYAERKEE